jgi:hypothetical protein
MSSALNEVNSYDHLMSLLEIERKKATDLPKTEPIVQQLTSLLFYGMRRETRVAGNTLSIRSQIGIDWGLPTVVLEINQVFSKNFITEALHLLSRLIFNGFSMNVIIITHEKDEYSQNTHNFVEKVIGNIDNDHSGKDFGLAERITILNEAAIEKELYQGIVASADLFWNASNHSLDNLIESEYRKINV